MRFSPFAVLSCLAALAAAGTLQAVNLERAITTKSESCCCKKEVGLTFRANK